MLFNMETDVAKLTFFSYTNYITKDIWSLSHGRVNYAALTVSNISEFVRLNTDVGWEGLAQSQYVYMQI